MDRTIAPRKPVVDTTSFLVGAWNLKEDAERFNDLLGVDVSEQLNSKGLDHVANREGRASRDPSGST